MKNKNFAFYTSLTLLVLFSVGFGYVLHKYQTQKKLSRIVDWNTKQIHSIGVASATESFETDCLMQILHAVDGQDFSIPERDKVSEMLFSDDSIEDDDVPHTFEQIERDQIEVDQSIRAFASGNLFQAETLYTILNKIKDKE